MKPRIVVTGVNLVEAGPLSIYIDALTVLANEFSQEYEVIALVNKNYFVNNPQIQVIEFPNIKTSWARRIRFEYYDLYKISKKLDAHLWLSLHDMTPRVYARVQAVYCHNPAPFGRLRVRDLIYDWKYSAFRLFYRYIYGLNIHRNNYVIVQQAWIRERFREMYGVRNVIVAHPKLNTSPSQFADGFMEKPLPDGQFRFFYPAFPRVFKNVELLLQAAEILKDDAIEIWLTFSGQESRYARNLSKRCRHLPSIKLLGRLTREQVFARYGYTDCLVFPSLLETWGLPISEFKQTGKPILAANLPYAHETVGTYESVHFFDADDPRDLASLMRRLSLGLATPGLAVATAIEAPFARDWSELFKILLRTEADDSDHLH